MNIDDLKRFRVGKSVGVLAIFAGPGTSGDRLFTKNGPEASFPGDDASTNFAESESDRSAIFAALHVTDPAGSAELIVADYSEDGFPKRNGVALLGSIGSIPGLAKASRRNIQAFLRGLLENPGVNEEDDLANVIRRQSMMALALQADLERDSIVAVARVVTRTKNHFLCSAVGSFFEHQRDQVFKASDLEGIKRILASGMGHSVQQEVIAMIESGQNQVVAVVPDTT